MKTIKTFFSKHKKIFSVLMVVLLVGGMLTMPAFAAGKGDVAGAVEETWKEAVKQIKTVCDNVVFPALAVILGIVFFVKLGSAYFDCASVLVIL